MIRVAASIFAFLLLVLPSAARSEESIEVIDIRPSKLRSVRSSARVPLLLDVRTSYEYSAGHIPGAVNIPHSKLEERLPAVREGARHGVVVYCMRGPRARVGEGILQEQEIGPLYHLAGGFLAWKKAGYSVETGEHLDDDDNDD